MIQDAVQAKYPEIVVIGTSGSQPDGDDFDLGWQLAREIETPMVDEHFYRPPQWLLDNLERYDSYDRNGPKVYVGEYAAHETNRANTLRAALAEAAFMTSPLDTNPRQPLNCQPIAAPHPPAHRDQFMICRRALLESSLIPLTTTFLRAALYSRIVHGTRRAAGNR